MITLHFHLIPQYKYELFHIYFTELNMADPEASKYINALSDKRLKYLTSTLLQWSGPNKL